MFSLELLRLEDLSFAYQNMPPVHQGLNFSLNQGDRIGILGPNGAGKSTMFLLAMGLLKPSGGQIFHRGRECADESGFP